MEISVIVIGDELLLGQVTDTNSGFIARHIATEGWSVKEVCVVPDDAQAIRSAIDRAFENTRIVLTTGGLGPTKDDITKEALRTYFGGELRLVSSVLDNIREVFRKRGLQLNNLTESQAMVPSSARVIQNKVGTAPIMWFEDSIRERVLVAMPGVPFETREMFTSEVFPQLIEKFPSENAVLHRTVIVEGITESDLAEHLASWEKTLHPSLHLAYLPTPGLIRLRLDGQGPDPQSLRVMLDEKTNELINLCGPHFLYDGDATPEQILLQELTSRSLTLATAESCTGGTIAARITAIPGSSAAMKGAVVAYCNEVKRSVLGVSPLTLNENGAVSIPTVKEMAIGARRALEADIAIATSGIAGPSGATPGKPVGTVCIAVSTPLQTEAWTFHFPGNRQRVIDRSATTALLRAIRLLPKASQQ